MRTWPSGWQAGWQAGRQAGWQAGWSSGFCFVEKRLFYKVLSKILSNWPQPGTGVEVKSEDTLGRGKGFIVNASRSAPTKSEGKL